MAILLPLKNTVMVFILTQKKARYNFVRGLGGPTTGSYPVSRQNRNGRFKKSISLPI
jgi:hypothetical protein